MKAENQTKKTLLLYSKLECFVNYIYIISGKKYRRVIKSKISNSHFWVIVV